MFMIRSSPPPMNWTLPVVVLLFAACGPLRKPFAPPLPEPVPAGEKVLITGGDSAARARALADYTAAVDVHTRAFGGTPPVALLVLGSPAQLARFDSRPYREKGYSLTAIWIGPDGWSSSTTRHEACHELQQQRAAGVAGGKLRFVGPKRTLDIYSSPFLPDWFDEAGAMICEDESSHREREAVLVQKWDKRLPLSMLLSMDHPMAASAVASGPPSKGISMTSLPADRSARGDTLLMFYSQAYSVSRFLGEHQGAEFLSRMIDDLARGVAMDSILRVAPHPFASIASFQDAWERWVTSRPATGPPPTAVHTFDSLAISAIDAPRAAWYRPIGSPTTTHYRGAPQRAVQRTDCASRVEHARHHGCHPARRGSRRVSAQRLSPAGCHQKARPTPKAKKLWVLLTRAG